MKAELIFIFRHGPNTPDGFLTPDGLRAIEELGQKLKARYRISGMNACVVHSGELRALKTAQAMLPDVDENQERELFSSDRICDVNGAVDVVRTYAETARIVIVITHLEMAAKLPAAIGSQLFDVDDFPEQEVERGQGWVIDCRKETCEFVRF